MKNIQVTQMELEIIKTLYQALATKDTETLQNLLAPELEWWFHGPPSTREFLMHSLTGPSPSSSSISFSFEPLSLIAYKSTVLVEGFNKEWNVSWVHAWTVSNGIVTQVKEYLNTSVTVIAFAKNRRLSSFRASMINSVTKSASTSTIWRSKLCDNKSIPGLVLAL